MSRLPGIGYQYGGGNVAGTWGWGGTVIGVKEACVCGVFKTVNARACVGMGKFPNPLADGTWQF